MRVLLHLAMWCIADRCVLGDLVWGDGCVCLSLLLLVCVYLRRFLGDLQVRCRCDADCRTQCSRSLLRWVFWSGMLFVFRLVEGPRCVCWFCPLTNSA